MVLVFKDRHTDQWIKSQEEIIAHIYGQMTFDDITRPGNGGKDNLFDIMVLGKPDIHMQKLIYKRS